MTLSHATMPSARAAGRPGSAEVDFASGHARVRFAAGALERSRPVEAVTDAGHEVRAAGAAIALSRRIYAKIRQNLFRAFIYNLPGIPLAAAGLSGPVAGAAMAPSSVGVLAHAPTLGRRCPRFEE